MAKVPVNAEVIDVMQRILESTQNLQRRVFREMTRAEMNDRGTGLMRFDAVSILRDVDDLVSMTDEPD